MSTSASLTARFKTSPLGEFSLIPLFLFCLNSSRACSLPNLLISRRLRPEVIPAFFTIFWRFSHFARKVSWNGFTTVSGSPFLGTKNIEIIFSAASGVQLPSTTSANSFGSAGMPSSNQELSRALRYQSSSISLNFLTFREVLNRRGYQRYASGGSYFAIVRISQ
jgi:hypothetical protein